MPRFAGTPIEETGKKQRFAGAPVEPTEQPSGPSTGSDILKSAASGLRSGVEMLGGAFGDVADINSRVAAWLAEKVGASPETAQSLGDGARYLSPGFGISPKTADAQKATSALVGEHHQPETTAGEYARTIGEFAPAAALGPGRLGSRIATQAILPALGSETAGQVTDGSAAEPYARIAGALAGGLAPSALRRAVTPLPASPERIQMAQALEREGVDLTAGQRTGSERLRYAESELGGMAGQRMMDQQGEQFTRAALQRAGIDADRATPEVIDGAFTRIGQQFDDVAARNRLVPDPDMGRDLQTVLNEYGQLVPESQRAPIVENIATDIVDAVQRNGGSIPGDSYQSLRSRLDRAARGSRADPELSDALQGLRNSLDDAMERSITANNPADAGVWREARNQYRNMLVLERAATGAGEGAAAGLVSPSALRNATVQGHGRRNYARGQGDFAELSRAGEALMRPLPQSGTAPRTAARSLGAALPSLIGAAAGSAASPGLGTLLGGAAGAAAPYAVGRALLSGPGRAYLGNQLMTGANAADPRLAAIIAALMGSSNQRALPPPQ